MTKRYETGTRIEVMRYMCTCAIMDRQAFLDGHYDQFGRLHECNKKIVQETKTEIRDFEKLEKSLAMSNHD